VITKIEFLGLTEFASDPRLYSQAPASADDFVAAQLDGFAAF